jgi:hypothetical protein
MNLPGFNAQRCLYRSAANYRTLDSSTGSNRLTAEGCGIAPAMIPAGAPSTCFIKCVAAGGSTSGCQKICSVNVPPPLCPPEQSYCGSVEGVPSCCPPGQQCCSTNPPVCCTSGSCSNGCCLVHPIGQLTSGTNYLLNSGCQPIKDLSVSLAASQSLVASNGFSMQLNAYNLSGPTTSWMQYAITVSGTAISATVQYWDMALFNPCASGNCTGLSGQSLTNSNCKTNGNCLNACASSSNPAACANACVISNCTGPAIWLFHPSVPIPLPSPLTPNTLPANWVLEIELNYDSSGINIAGATFTATNTSIPPPNTYTASIPVPPGFQFPIVAFQVDVVGPSGGSSTTFSQGAGTIVYRANNQLCVEGGLPDVCSKSAGSGTATAETSNTTYGAMSDDSCCGLSLTQPFST